MSNNFLRSLPTTVAQLTSLTLISNSITSIDGIENLVNVPALLFDNNNIETIPAAFRNLKNLTKLSLSNNKLKSITGEISDMPKLASISLQNNLLEVANGFVNLPSLTTINLNYNRLQSFPDGFQSSKNLIMIQIQGNMIRNVTGDFSALKNNWVSIDLGYNQVQNLNGLGTFPFINTLTLRNNSLSEIPTFFKTAKNSILNIDLTFNNIIDISGNFSNLRRLTSLTLHGNLIQTVNGTTFPQSLTDLNLNANNFTSVPTTLRNTGIKQLFLAGNWINGTLNPSTFPVNLQSLALTGNCFDTNPNIPLVTSFNQRTKEECVQHFQDLVSPIPKTSTKTPTTTTRKTKSVTSYTSKSKTGLPSTTSRASTTTASVFTVSTVSTPVLTLSLQMNTPQQIFSTKPPLPKTLASLITKQEVDRPMGTQPDDGDAFPIPTTTSVTTTNEDLFSNSILRSKYLLPVTMVATMVFAMAIAALVLIFIRRRRQEHSAPAASSAATLNNHDDDTDMENGEMERPASTSSKEVLLFRSRFIGVGRRGFGSAGNEQDEPRQHQFSTSLHLHLKNDWENAEEKMSEEERVEEKLQETSEEKLEEISDGEDEDISTSEIAESEEAVTPSSSSQDPLPSVHNWNAEQVQAWMDSAGFREEVVETFARHQIDGQGLLGLTDRILDHELGISNPSIRSSILTIRARAFMNVNGGRQENV
ncbi:hypothetical protein HDU97_006601 [Phlyctochytrium planicorne]|nr:hypothetical protein HDU97_006601 [Phlyctochytrium planicorne]